VLAANIDQRNTRYSAHGGTIITGNRAIRLSTFSDVFSRFNVKEVTLCRVKHRNDKYTKELMETLVDDGREPACHGVSARRSGGRTTSAGDARQNNQAK